MIAPAPAPATAWPQIRAAASDDAARVAALVTEVAARFVLPDCTLEGCRRFLGENQAAATAARIAAGYRYWVADCGGELVGVLALRGGVHLYHLFVAEAWQRRGLARQLWAQALAGLAAAGCGPVYTVNAAPAAVPVYERFGFVATASARSAGGVVYVPMRYAADATRAG